MIDTASAGQTLATSAQQVVTDLQRARTEQVNRESAARLAKQNADQATVDAQTSQDAAVAALKSAQQTFADQQGQLTQLTAQRTAAQAKLDAGARVVGARDRASRKPLRRWRTRPARLGPRAGDARACAGATGT